MSTATTANTTTADSLLSPEPVPLKLAFDRRSVYDLAKHLADDCRLYFRCISTSQFRHRFGAACDKLWACLSSVETYADQLSSQMLKYDYDGSTPGNGYRSVIAVLDSCVLHTIRLLRDIKEQREYVLFRTNYFCKELEAYSTVIEALKRDLHCVVNHLYLWKSSKELFPVEEHLPELDALMNLVETYDHSCFYGRCMGFQYASSLFRVFQVVGFGLASYSILWEKGAPESWSQSVTNLYQSGRFAINPEERAQRIADVIMNADISFCKSFWNLTEGPFLQDLPKWFCPNLALNEIWSIPCEDPLFLESSNGFYIKITPPTAHTGPRPLPLRVMSLRKRVGMSSGMHHASKDNTNKAGSEELTPKVTNLLFHCHGGGFVATSSKTHEMYLRHWTQCLDCTVVSVDYSLAPENPYPRAVEEVLYAYAWVLNNASRLGWTGERICFAGDSAGGHILMSTVLRAMNMQISRLPDGLVLIYSPFLVEYSPSPSRLLSFLDPLLPPGIMARCIAAYIGVTETVSTKEGCVVKSPLTSGGRLSLSEYEFKLKSPQTNGNGNGNVNIPEYELNLTAATASAKDEIKNLPKSLNGHKLVESRVLPEVTEIDGSDDEGAVCEPKSDFSPPVIKQKSVDYGTLTKGRTIFARQRSQSDTAVETLGLKRLRSIPNADGGDTDSLVDESDFNEEMATVRIQKDPRRIVVSSGAYDRGFMEYLSQHELTSSSLVRLKIPPSRKHSNSAGDGGSPLDESAPKTNANGAMATSPGGQSASPRSPFFYNLSFGRSHSTSSLSSVSQQIGEKLGTVTGYVLDGLSFFLDQPPPPPPSNSSPNGTPVSIGGGAQEDPAQVQVRSDDHMFSVPSSRLAHFHKLDVPRDPFLSPLRADDEILAKLPRVALIACHLDPLLDDSITMAKRLRRNKVDVTLDLLDSLPHGFLNFTLFSAECRSGAKQCLKRISEVFNPINEPNA